MRYARANRPAPFVTPAQAQAGSHYACHEHQPDGAHHPLAHAAAADMDRMLATEAHGIPTHFDYRDGQIRVWPAPGEGWQVWRALDGKLVAGVS